MRIAEENAARAVLATATVRREAIDRAVGVKRWRRSRISAGRTVELVEHLEFRAARVDSVERAVAVGAAGRHRAVEIAVAALHQTRRGAGAFRRALKAVQHFVCAARRELID